MHAAVTLLFTTHFFAAAFVPDWHQAQPAPDVLLACLRHVEHELNVAHATVAS